MKDMIKVKYGEGSKRKIKKYKNETMDNVVLKDWYYFGNSFYKNSIKVNNMIIDYKALKKGQDEFLIYNINCKNIFFKNTENLGGLTLSIDYLKKNKINDLELSWLPNDGLVSKIKEINIISKNKINTIKLDNEELERININFDDNSNLLVTVENKCSRKTYIINELGECKEEIIYQTIIKKDLNNGELDLTKFEDLSVLSLDNIEIDTLIINKNQIKYLKNINLYDDVFIKEIKIVDGNNMKLNPITIIPFNDTLNYGENYIIGDKKEILIYVDSKDDLKVFNKEEILKDENIEKVEFIKNKEELIIIYKYKKDSKYKVIIDYGYFDIDRLFTFYSKTKKSYIKDNDWIKIINSYLTVNGFIDLCTDYIDFKINLRKLLDYGFSYKYFMYLHQKGLDSVIYGMCQKDFDISKFSKNEINEINELGKKYIKKLK